MITVQTAFQEYLKDCEVNDLSKATIKTYAALLKPFVAAFAMKRLSELDHVIMRTYCLEIRKGKQSDATKYDRVNALHVFFSWASKRFKIDSPMGNIKRPRMPDPRPKALSPETFMMLYKACGNDNLIARRNQAILLFLVDTGVRASGLINLRMEDLNFQKRFAIIRNEKRGKTRKVFFSHWTAVSVRQYLMARQDAEYVFARDDNGQLTYSGLREMVRRLSKKAGVEKEIHNLHSFRHLSGISQLLGGAGLAQVSKLLGHKSVKVTADYYAIFDERDLAQEHDQYSPVRAIFRREKL